MMWRSSTTTATSRPGGGTNPASPADAQTYLDDWIEFDFANARFGDIVNDIGAQFANATHFYAINPGVTTPQITTYFVDHGFQGTNGSDVVIDGSGDDVVVVGGGNNVVKLGQGNDWAWLGLGDDAVRAAAGDDTVLGFDGADTLSGGSGQDHLLGGAGRDNLRGGADADRLEGGADNDVLTSGSRADRFVFAGGSGRNAARDFQDGSDGIEIDMVSTNLSGYSDLSLSQQGNKVLVDLGNGDEIVLKNMQLAEVTAADCDFDFV